MTNTWIQGTDTKYQQVLRLGPNALPMIQFVSTTPMVIVMIMIVMVT